MSAKLLFLSNDTNVFLKILKKCRFAHNYPSHKVNSIIIKSIFVIFFHQNWIGQQDFKCIFYVSVETSPADWAKKVGNCACARISEELEVLKCFGCAHPY